MRTTRRDLAKTAALAALAPRVTNAEIAAPGIWRFRFGTPERITPTSTRKYKPADINGLPRVTECPATPVSGGGSHRGYQVRIPLEPNELIYGFGLQLQAFMQRGLKRVLRVNADPEMNTGDSHAPVPFYVTTKGYGVLIDTARYAVVYAGNKPRKNTKRTQADSGTATVSTAAGVLPEAYGRFRVGEPSEVIIEVPETSGVDIYVFGGPTMRDAVQRYNLFSGGGAVPPRWGLGFWYRCHGQSDQDQVKAIARSLREERIPCDVLGLEPGWQTHAYSCTFVWSKKFPDPAAMVRELGDQHYRVNLWEHAFTHPDSPIHDALLPHSGDYLVWDGLVPDFLQPEARRIFADYHSQHHVALGVAGYKLDECDNSDYTGNWSFPELSRFPSGADGEQMHCLLGLRYQDTIQSAFESRKEPTYGLVRSSGALAAPYPYVLYSDLYNHREFIRGVVNCGFSGLLWCPEVRDARDPEDLIRRLQTVVFSPLAMVNAWYIRNPPWKQVNQKLNNEGQFASGWEKVEQSCREIIEWRMRLIPYLHSAFGRYQRTGMPPFRALVMDSPDDPATFTIDDQYMMGESILVAPVTAGQMSREVYLPRGDWYDFWTGERRTGGAKITVSPPLNHIPVYVKSGSMVPLAMPTLHTGDEESLHLEVRGYGPSPAPFELQEGNSFARLEWDRSLRHTSGSDTPIYEVVRWTPIS